MACSSLIPVSRISLSIRLACGGFSLSPASSRPRFGAVND